VRVGCYLAVVGMSGLEPGWLANTAAKQHVAWRDRPQYQLTTAGKLAEQPQVGR
jgi:hypothetical protein